MGDIRHLTPKIPAIERQLYMQATRPVKRKKWSSDDNNNGKIRNKTSDNKTASCF